MAGYQVEMLSKENKRLKAKIKELEAENTSLKEALAKAVELSLLKQEEEEEDEELETFSNAEDGG